jgi:hypothetical protein
MSSLPARFLDGASLSGLAFVVLEMVADRDANLGGDASLAVVRSVLQCAGRLVRDPRLYEGALFLRCWHFEPSKEEREWTLDLSLGSI